jgi:hypothetical protein
MPTNLFDSPNKKPVIPPAHSHKRRFSFRVFLQQLVNFVIWVIVVTLTLRILLLLLAANTNAPFSDFIFYVSDFVAWPFYGLFTSKPVAGVSYFDASSLVGIVVYLLAGLGLNKLLSVTKT